MASGLSCSPKYMLLIWAYRRNPSMPFSRPIPLLLNPPKGVLITDVVAGTPAAERGLKPGDVIVEVQQEEVSAPADVVDRVEKIRKANRRSVLMLVQSGDGLRWVPLSLAPSDKKPG